MLELLFFPVDPLRSPKWPSGDLALSYCASSVKPFLLAEHRVDDVVGRIMVPKDGHA